MGKAEANLREEVDRLKDVNGDLCAEINRQEKRIRELESIVRSLYADYSHEWPDRAEELYGERIAKLRLRTGRDALAGSASEGGAV